MTTRSGSNELNAAQDRFSEKHGEAEAGRLFAAIEAVVQGAPLDERGWDNRLFLGTAARIYSRLADVDEVSDDEFWAAVSARENNHHVGTLGWELLWQWRVAMRLWRSTPQFKVPVGRHNDGVGDQVHFRREYERALRSVVRSEIVSYYFDHTEHSQDVDFLIHQQGLSDSCDAHGVAAFYHRIADMGLVRDLFEGMSSVPGTMKLETFMQAVREAYKVADKAGHGNSLRGFETVADDIASHRNRTAVMSNQHQRGVDPDDSSFSMLADDASLDLQNDVLLTPTEARVIIGSVVNQIQVNHNSLGIQATNSDFEQVQEALSGASPSVLSRVIKEWLPQALIAGTIGLLLGLLRSM